MVRPNSSKKPWAAGFCKVKPNWKRNSSKAWNEPLSEALRVPSIASPGAAVIAGQIASGDLQWSGWAEVSGKGFVVKSL